MKKSCTFCQPRQIGQSKSFYRFPVNNPKILKQWLINMGNKDFQPTKDSFLCSDHFLGNQFRNEQKRISPCLKNNAIPTVFGIDKKVENGKRDDTKSEAEKPKRKENVPTTVSELDICTEVTITQGRRENEVDESVVESVNQQNITDEKSVPSDCLIERNLKNKLEKTKNKLFTTRHQLKIFKQKVKRLNRQLFTLHSIVSTLRRKKSVSEHGLLHLESFQDSATNVIIHRL